MIELNVQPAPHGTGPEIAPLVVEDIQQRVVRGIRKYGEPLRATNGRDALVDAYEEALDLVMYLRQAIEERTEFTTVEHGPSRATMHNGNIAI